MDGATRCPHNTCRGAPWCPRQSAWAAPRISNQSARHLPPPRSPRAARPDSYFETSAGRARRKRRARVKTHRLRVCLLDWPHAPALVPSGARRRRHCVLHGAFATGGSGQRRFRDGDGSYKNEKTCYVATSRVSRFLGRFSCEAIKHIFVRYRSMKKRIRSFSRLFLVASIEMHPIECEKRIG